MECIKYTEGYILHFLPQAFNSFRCTWTRQLHTLGTYRVASWGHHLPHCVPSSNEAFIIPHKYPCSPYPIPTKMPSRNDLKLLQETDRTKPHQRLEQWRLQCMSVCLFLIWQGVLLSALFMGWGGWINSQGRLRFIKSNWLLFLGTKDGVFFEGWGS